VRNVDFEGILAIRGLRCFSAGDCVGGWMLIVGAVDQRVIAGKRWAKSDVDIQRIGKCRTVAGQGDIGHLGVEFGW
jgi:hypothetical protein